MNILFDTAARCTDEYQLQVPPEDEARVRDMTPDQLSEYADEHTELWVWVRSSNHDTEGGADNCEVES